MDRQLGPGGSYFLFTLGPSSPQLVQASQKLPRCQDVSHPFPSLSGIIGYCLSQKQPCRWMGVWAWKIGHNTSIAGNSYLLRRYPPPHHHLLSILEMPCTLPKLLCALLCFIFTKILQRVGAIPFNRRGLYSFRKLTDQLKTVYLHGLSSK